MENNNLSFLISYIKDRYKLKDVIFVDLGQNAGDYLKDIRTIRLNPYFDNKDITLFHEVAHCLILDNPKLVKYGLGTKGCYTTEYLCEWFAWRTYYSIKLKRARTMALSYVSHLEREQLVKRNLFMKAWINEASNYLKKESNIIKKAYWSFQ